MEGEGELILGTGTLTKLGILKIKPEINSLAKEDSTAEIVDRYKSLFKVIGKLKDFQLKNPIDSSIEPVCQTARRVPYHLRDKLSQKLKELEKLDIIEKTTGPTHWVSPVIVVPKSDRDIRLCVDMRRANLAVKRKRHPIDYRLVYSCPNNIGPSSVEVLPIDDAPPLRFFIAALNSSKI